MTNKNYGENYKLPAKMYVGNAYFYDSGMHYLSRDEAYKPKKSNTPIHLVEQYTDIEGYEEYRKKEPGPNENKLFGRIMGLYKGDDNQLWMHSEILDAKFNDSDVYQVVAYPLCARHFFDHPDKIRSIVNRFCDGIGMGQWQWSQSLLAALEKRNDDRIERQAEFFDEYFNNKNYFGGEDERQRWGYYHIGEGQGQEYK